MGGAVWSGRCKAGVTQKMSPLEPKMHVIDVASGDYVFGLFRHFSKFHNHEKSPFECDSAICLLSAVAPPTCAESLALVNTPFMIPKSPRAVTEVKREVTPGAPGAQQRPLPYPQLPNHSICSQHL